MDIHSLNDCRFYDIPEFFSEEGVLRVIERGADFLPFDFDRVFFISDVPERGVRGDHVTKNTHELLLAFNGSFDMEIDDGSRRKLVTIDDPRRPFYLPCGIWRTLKNFQPSTVCVVLASGLYDGEECVSDYDEYLQLMSGV